MAVKILIKRNVSEEKEMEILPLLNALRSRTMSQEGYISGETLKRVDRPDQVLVISTWQSVDDWRKWHFSSERSEIQEKIDALLGEKTEYEVYIHG